LLPAATECVHAVAQLVTALQAEPPLTLWACLPVWVLINLYPVLP